jgi:phosphatidylserine/phosphatidylglycerophosphate/cardiolipin synthase-like enzyme
VTETAHLTVAVAPDNAYEVVKEAIEGAQNSIWIEGYTFENAHLIDAVVAQAQAGRTVRVLLEGEKVSDQERWFCQRLVNSGGEAYFFHNDGDADIHDRYRFQHAKFVIVDGRLLIVGSENFNPSGLPNDDKGNGTWGRRGAFLLTDAPSVVARAQAIFERDLDTAHRDIVAWSASHPRYGAPTPGFAPTYVYTDWVTYTTRFSRPLHLAGEPLAFELLHSPENSLRDQGGLLGLVNRAGAGDTLLVEQLYERVHWGPTASTPASDPNPRLDAYVDAARRGARVRILLNGSADAGSVSENGETRAYVNDIAHDEGLDLELRLGDPAGRGIHNKMVLAEIDGRGTVHVGSINGSELSCKGNREMALQVQSDAAYTYLADVFDFDWHISGPLFLPLVLHGYAPPPPPVEYVVVSEVMYRPYLGEPPGNTEWVELYNPTTEAVDLTGWSVGDAAAPGEYGSGTYHFPAGATLPAQETLVVAQQAADVEFTPHFELALDPGRDDAGVPNLVPDGSWEGFGMALGNGGDEVILRDAGGADVDVVVWDDPSDDPVLKGTYPGVTPWQGLVATSWSLERRPIYYDSDDCSVDLIPRYPATPGSVP